MISGCLLERAKTFFYEGRGGSPALVHPPVSLRERQRSEAISKHGVAPLAGRGTTMTAWLPAVIPSCEGDGFR